MAIINTIAIPKLYFANLDVCSPLSSIISNIPAIPKNIIKTEIKDKKSSLNTGNLIKAYIATIIADIP